MKGIDQIQIAQATQAGAGDASDRLSRLAAKVKHQYDDKEVSEIVEQSRNFESMIVKMMLDSMRKTVEHSDLFGDPSSPSRSIYQSMLDNEYARLMSERQGMGLSVMVQEFFGVDSAQGRLKVDPASRDMGIGALGENLPNTNERFIEPLRGRMSSPFGMRVHPLSGNLQMHDGIDIAVESGTKVRAAASGTVIFAGEKGGYGNTVIIDHGNGRSSLYAHLDEIDVNAGDEVRKGRLIARSGNTGVSTGPHLHFEIREGDRPVNPVDFIPFY